MQCDSLDSFRHSRFAIFFCDHSYVDSHYEYVLFVCTSHMRSTLAPKSISAILFRFCVLCMLFCFIESSFSIWLDDDFASQNDIYFFFFIVRTQRSLLRLMTGVLQMVELALRMQWITHSHIRFKYIWMWYKHTPDRMIVCVHCTFPLDDDKASRNTNTHAYKADSLLLLERKRETEREWNDWVY